MCGFAGIRAIPSFGDASIDGGINSAILRYDGALEADPTSTPTPNPVEMNEADLHVSIYRSSILMY